MTFIRVCPRHKEKLIESDGKTGKMLTCPQGHLCRSWIVVEEDQHYVVGKAWISRDGMHVGPPPRKKKRQKKRPPGKPPHRPCIHGHTNWKKTSQGKYLCKDCQKRSWTRMNKKRAQERKR
jgi:hypothetical protein